MADTLTASDAQLLADSLGQLPEAVLQPALIVVSGLPGTGKSYFCRRLAQQMPVLILESDALRRMLSPAPDYSPQESARLFRAIHQLIGMLLRRGIPLALDATNLSERHRERLYHIADRLNARLILVRVEASPGLVRQRLQQRAEARKPEDVSDADWAVYLQMKTAAQRISRRHYVADTSRDISPVIAKIIKEARR